jgi:hypothetical protein
MKKNHLIIALVMLMSASLCLAQASKQRKSRKSSTAKAAQTHVMPACSIGDIRITSKAKGTRCLHLVSVPPVGEPPSEGLFVACPYPQKFSSCHGAGNWGCGSQDGVRGCWTN